ncbi:M55 family metallopeptidase, partial [Streptomyces sp. NPDC001193]
GIAFVGYHTGAGSEGVLAHTYLANSITGVWLEWLARRKELLSTVARELEDSAIGSMLRMAPEDPDRLLEEIAEQLLADVAKREAELAALVG